MNKQVNENKPETLKSMDLCDMTWYKMDLAVRTKNLALVRFVAEEDFLSLTEYWYWVTGHAISFDFIELLKYLQNDLKVDFAEKIRELSPGDLEGLTHDVFVAAVCGRHEIVEYVVREFKNQEIFNAAFCGAARGGNRRLLHWLHDCISGFHIGNELLNEAVEENLEKCAEVIAQITRYAQDTFVLEKNKEGKNALDKADEIVQFLSQFRK